MSLHHKERSVYLVKVMRYIRRYLKDRGIPYVHRVQTGVYYYFSPKRRKRVYITLIRDDSKTCVCLPQFYEDTPVVFAYRHLIPKLKEWGLL